MSADREAHLRAMDLCSRGSWLRRHGLAAEARVAFRRAWALEVALAQKLAKNRARTWVKGVDGQWSHVKGGAA